MKGGQKPAGQEKQVKAFQRIKARSSSLVERMKEYTRIKAEWLPMNPQCHICLEECGAGKRPSNRVNKTDDVHHMRGRLGKNLTDTMTWLPVCRGHHHWIDANRAEAMRLGYLQSRLSK